MSYIDPFGKEHRYGPPAGWVQPARQSVGPAEWDALVARGLLRFDPYDGPTELRAVRGDCLAPLITDRDALRVRPIGADEPLIDGGLYAIRWTNEDEAQAYRDKINLQSKEPIVVAKFLRYIGGMWYCQCNTALMRLADGVVIAVVVGIVAGCTNGGPAIHARALPCGNPFSPEPAHCAELGDNAATNVSLGTAASTTLNTSSYTMMASLTVGPFDAAAEVVITCTGEWAMVTGVNAETSPIVNVGIATTMGGGQQIVYNPKTTQAAGTTTNGGIAQEQTFALAQGATGTYYWTGLGGGGQTTTTAYILDATMKAEVIKK